VDYFPLGLFRKKSSKAITTTMLFREEFPKMYR
jgi:hypothetical protein